ncbi:murein biosynthesis integral membrane protein MurJ, partial [Streptomyces otsuchiensis]|uniref:murein biosynthesis integral membrane protein MurJ n=2 Tax=Streptomyces TaxID=1883 RepID=UPI001D1311C7
TYTPGPHAPPDPRFWSNAPGPQQGATGRPYAPNGPHDAPHGPPQGRTTGGGGAPAHQAPPPGAGRRQGPPPGPPSGPFPGAGQPQGDDRPAAGGHDAFANLYRDQQAAPRAGAPMPGPMPGPNAAAVPPPPASEAEAEVPQPAPAPSPRKQGRAASVLKSSAIMAAGTLVSRATGFVRQLIIVAALGAAVLGDTYAVAWALPSMIYILTIGGGLNSVFVPQLVRAMKDDEDGGEAYANRLLTLVMVILGALVLISVVIAPLLIRMMSAKLADDPAANEVAVTFARYCLPTIFFMGVHVVMGQVLNARDRFGPMMWTPVLNNIVVIFTFGMFLWVYGTQSSSGLSVQTISPEGIRLLGIGTLLGLTVQAVAMVPYLRAAGFRMRPRFDWVGHGMGKAMKLAKWTVLFVLANQVGLVAITQFATWAGDNAEQAGFPGTGFIAYSSALLIWQMPQAIITVSIMAALLPRISRSAADGDNAAVRDDLSHGLRTSAVAIVPISFAFVALGIPMCTLLFGSAGEDGARSFGYILMAFGLGLIPFSAQYVVLRAFYAYEDTRTPFYNTVVVSAVWIALSATCFALLPDRWVVAGIAFSYGIAYVVGVGIAWRRLKARMGTDLDGARVVRTYIRLCGAAVPAAALGGGTGYVITEALGSGMLGSLAALAGGSLVLLVVFYLAARKMRIEELTSLVGMVRARLGR